MKKVAVLVFVLCLLLSGCTNWMGGSYSSVKPHSEPAKHTEQKTVPVYKYNDLTGAIASFVESGAKVGVVSMQYGSGEEHREEIEKAIREVQKTNPFAAYSVSGINYAFDEGLGQNTALVRVSYLPDRVHSDQIPRVQTTEQARNAIAQQLDECGAGVVLYFSATEQMDFVRFVEEYALQNPQTVMEKPTVTVSCYPKTGSHQVVALEFSYKSSQAELLSMQNKVAPVFSSAQQQVTGNWSQAEKTLRLYTFLMNRYEYNIRTSVTPAYSLLLNGEGDCRAFAMVYGAMCNQAGIDCRVVTGTKGGKPWTWNAVKLDGKYYYIDLLQCSENGVFALYEADKMTGYVWNAAPFRT